jgi:hypothetical protein
MNDLTAWILAAAMAFVMAAGHLLNGPTELDAVQAVADEVAALTGGEK